MRGGGIMKAWTRGGKLYFADQEGISHYAPTLTLSAWGRRLFQDALNSGRRRRHRLHVRDTRRIIHSYDGSTVRQLRLEKPLDTLKHYGVAYFVFEVKQLLEVERQKRGYAPPLDEIYTLIEREFGQAFAEASRDIHFPGLLQRFGFSYSAIGASEYHEHPDVGLPLLDMSAPYAPPWGTVGDYVYWQLKRLPVGDYFTVADVVIRRVDDAVFSIDFQALRRGVAGESLHHAIARVLLVLRYGNSPEFATVNFRPPSRTPVRAAPVMPVPAPKVAPRLPSLPALIYSSTEERRALAVEYTAKGYSMAAIQAALVRADLAAKGGQDVQ